MSKKTLVSLLLIFSLVLLSLAGCTPSSEPKKVVVASKPFAESYILSELIKQVIESKTDIEVELKTGIAGGTANIHPAMEKGEIDIYPEYTGTGWLFVLKEALISDPMALYEATKEKYSSSYKMKWMGLYGFNNTYTLAVSKKNAEQYNLITFTDLAAVSGELTLGAEYDFFERDDGFKALTDAYGFSFKDTKEMDIGLKYEAIGAEEVDVINAFSTDGLLKEFELVVLKDDLNFFPAYHAASVVREETLAKYPELEEALMLLEGILSDAEMIELNYKVEKENKDPKDVAAEFLASKGL